MNIFEDWILKKLAKKAVKQGGHEKGIISFYSYVNDAAKNEFTEDTKPELDLFLSDCHKYSLERRKSEHNHLWVAADNHAVKGGLVCMNCGKVKAT